MGKKSGKPKIKVAGPAEGLIELTGIFVGPAGVLVELAAVFIELTSILVGSTGVEHTC